MKHTSIRELRHETSKVLAMVETGEMVEVRRHDRVVAILSPPGKKTPISRPDFAGRLRAIYGDKILSTSGSELISELRGER